MCAIIPSDVGSCSYAGTGYANPHAVTSIGGTTYTYDNNGNVTAIGSLDYTWDWRNRLASAERSGGVTTYGYDHTGQRVFKATGSATTSYPNRYYNIASSSLTATTTKHIFSPDGTLLATVVGASTTATTTYLHADHLGGTNVATDEDGEVVQTLDYYPYGSQRIATGSFAEQRRFIGEEFDGDTNFSYLNARYYQGSRGKFMSQDPAFLAVGTRDLAIIVGADGKNETERIRDALRIYLSNPQQINSYAYALNNPLVLVDDNGEWFKEFLTRQQSWNDFQLELGEATTQLTKDNRFWNFAVGHPYSTGAASGIVVGSGAVLHGSTIITVYGYYDSFRNLQNFANILANPENYATGQINVQGGSAYVDALGRIAQVITPTEKRQVYELVRGLLSILASISQEVDEFP
jgi:RHS repeat-associated protein